MARETVYFFNKLRSPIADRGFFCLSEKYLIGYIPMHSPRQNPSTPSNYWQRHFALALASVIATSSPLRADEHDIPYPSSEHGKERVINKTGKYSQVLNTMRQSLLSAESQAKRKLIYKKYGLDTQAIRATEGAIWRFADGELVNPIRFLQVELDGDIDKYRNAMQALREITADFTDFEYQPGMQLSDLSHEELSEYNYIELKVHPFISMLAQEYADLDSQISLINGQIDFDDYAEKSILFAAKAAQELHKIDPKSIPKPFLDAFGLLADYSDLNNVPDKTLQVLVMPQPSFSLPISREVLYKFIQAYCVKKNTVCIESFPASGNLLLQPDVDLLKSPELSETPIIVTGNYLGHCPTQTLRNIPLARMSSYALSRTNGYWGYEIATNLSDHPAFSHLEANFGLQPADGQIKTLQDVQQWLMKNADFLRDDLPIAKTKLLTLPSQ